jgi:hypothetical protein
VDVVIVADVAVLELCRCIVSDGDLMPDRSFMTLVMGA